MTKDEALKRLKPFLGDTKELAIELESLTKYHLLTEEIENFSEVIREVKHALPDGDWCRFLKVAPMTKEYIETIGLE